MDRSSACQGRMRHLKNRCFGKSANRADVNDAHIGVNFHYQTLIIVSAVDAQFYVDLPGVPLHSAQCQGKLVCDGAV